VKVAGAAVKVAGAPISWGVCEVPGWGYQLPAQQVIREIDRVWRPEQLPSALLGAMRVLTDPAETGAVTLALPQDVQAQAWDWPAELFRERVWHVPRTPPDPAALSRAVAVIAAARRPLIVAGGGVLYSGACDELRLLADACGIPVAQTQAGKSSMRSDDPLCVGGLGVTGTTAANELAGVADVVIGVGTRWTDFTTGSRSVFGDPGVRFVNLNVAAMDAAKHGGVAVTADARAGLAALRSALRGSGSAPAGSAPAGSGDGWAAPSEHRARATQLSRAWQSTVEAAYTTRHSPLPAQAEVIGAVNEAAGSSGIVLTAAGSMPGDLHKLWRTGDPGSYHVEYGYSCMGYEIAGGLGAKLAAPDRDVFVLVGDGSYLMMASELVTAVQEGIKLIVVCVDNHGFASIGSLSQAVGSQRFGTSYRFRGAGGLTGGGQLDGEYLPIDLAANAASLGVAVLRVATIDEFRDALAAAQGADRTTMVLIETDPSIPAPSSQAWWDVPVAEVSELASTRAARAQYQLDKRQQRPLF
jgi:3D-(3,5/4)-trihydroxycyclohexane-1,2-dione acylhydrolase (decyclizing)